MRARRSRAEADLAVALRSQLTGTVTASPLWRSRFADLGVDPAAIDSLPELARIVPLGERDVSPDGDPAGMARLVVQPSETNFALYGDGSKLRSAFRARAARDRDAYQRIVDSELRPTSYAWTGLGFQWPVAYTRGDLDVLARAGARAWTLAGLGPGDALLTVAPDAPEPAALSVQAAALASGAAAVVTAATGTAVTGAARLTPPTVVALPIDRLDLIADLLDGMRAESRKLLRTMLILGVPTTAQRRAISAVLPGVAVLAWHVPSGARLPWVECQFGGQDAGLHTFPDLDVVQLVDAETADSAAAKTIVTGGFAGGEVVLTQVAMRGTVLLRWRTGDLAELIAGQVGNDEPCPGCGRQLPRLVGVRPGALVAGSAGAPIDLRSVAGVLTGRADLFDWRIVSGHRERDGAAEVLIHIVPAHGFEAEDVALTVIGDVRATAGRIPSQVVLSTARELVALRGRRLSRRILLR